jgi:deoxycytidylate deaminase
MQNVGMLDFFSALYNTYKSSNQQPNSNVCAILYNKSKIISVGWNNPLSHAKVFRSTYNLPSTHAEVDALKKYIFTCKSPKRRIKVHIVVLRKNKTGKFVNSKPCKHCIEFMKSQLVSSFINIRNIIYVEDSEFKETTLNDITNEHVSYGWQHFHL